MSIDMKTVEHVANLARLELSESEKEHYLKDLNDILQTIDVVNAQDTKGVEPMAHPMDFSQRLREDDITEVNQRELLQKSAPQVEEGLYLVPRVVES